VNRAALAAALSWLAAGAATGLPAAGAEQPRFALEAPAVAPDTTGFWYYLRHGDAERAREELARLRRLAPEWQPADDMLDALQRAAATAGDPGDPARAAHDALMARLAALAPAQRDGIAPATLARAADGARRYAVPGDLLLLAWIHLQRGEYRRADGLLDEVQSLDATRDLDEARRASALARLREALDAQALPRIEGALDGAYADAAAGLVLGAAWTALDTGRAAAALPLFQMLASRGVADAAPGRALSLRALGRPGEATAAACAASDAPQLRTLCGDWLAEAQAAAYARGDYAEAVRLGDELAARGLLLEPRRALLAWSLYRLERYEEALPHFLALSELAPQREDYATALVTLLAGDAGRLEELAAQRPAVAAVWRQRRAEVARARKQFDLAARLGDRSLAGLRELTATAAASLRERDGETGLASLDTDRYAVDASALTGGWRWRLLASETRHRQGDVASGSWFGEAPVGDAFPGLDEVVDPGLRLELEHQAPGVTFYGALARDLLDQPANDGWTGQASLSLFRGDTTAALTAYRRYRADSLLSRTGTVDSRSGVSWGGALADGVRGLLVRQLGADWSVAASGHLERITGSNVEDNRGYGLRLDLTRSHGTGALDYWRSGPFVSTWRYRYNLSDFTVGHGGYFSPERFDSVGLGTELLSPEGRRWQVKVAANLAWSQIDQDGFRRFPLSDGGALVPGSDDSGASGEFTLQAQALITPHWRLAAYAYYLEAIEFQSTAVGVQLSWSAAPLGGLVSRLLPLENPWIKGYAL
jgi:hypothetical protein